MTSPPTPFPNKQNSTGMTSSTETSLRPNKLRVPSEHVLDRNARRMRKNPHSSRITQTRATRPRRPQFKSSNRAKRNNKMALQPTLGLIVKAIPTPGCWYKRRNGILRYKPRPNITPTDKTTQTGMDEDMERILIPTGRFTEGQGQAAQGMTTQVDAISNPKSLRKRKKHNTMRTPRQGQEQEGTRDNEDKEDQDEGIADCKPKITETRQIHIPPHRLIQLKTPRIHLHRLETRKKTSQQEKTSQREKTSHRKKTSHREETSLREKTSQKRETSHREKTTQREKTSQHKKTIHRVERQGTIMKIKLIETTPRGSRHLEELYKEMIRDNTTPTEAAERKLEDTWGPVTKQEQTDNTIRKPTRPLRPPTTKRKEIKSREFISSSSEDSEEEREKRRRWKEERRA